MHIFLWTELGNSLISSGYENIIHVINSTISIALRAEHEDPHMHKLVSCFQVHKHSFTCKKARKTCRFDYPRQTCLKTRLCNDPDVIIHQRGRFYDTRRISNDVWVNAYNPVILQHWRANMDIQLVGNAESCALYVCK